MSRELPPFHERHGICVVCGGETRARQSGGRVRDTCGDKCLFELNRRNSAAKNPLGEAKPHRPDTVGSLSGRR